MRRNLFPALRKFRAYLNTASLGLMPASALQRANELLTDVVSFEGEVNSVDYMNQVFLEPALREAAKLMGVHVENVGLSIQTTEGLRRLLLSMEPRKGQNIVSLDTEFPTIPALLKSYSKRFGLELRVVKNENGLHPLETIERAIDDNTLAVVLSSVNWVTGERINLRELSRAVHEHGAWLIVDAVQHLGSLRLYPEKEGVDALAAGGEKWLLSPDTGAGLIYASDEFLEGAKPITGLLNMEPPTENWGSWWGLPDKDPWGRLKVSEGVKKLDFGGGPPYIIAAAFRASLELINEVGIEEIERHNLRLAERVTDEALSAGLGVFGENSAIVTVKTGMSYEGEEEVYRRLSGRGIAVSHRGVLGHHGIRVSPHLYNTVEDVELFLEELFGAMGAG
ncbi:aminotransferase class V-fold PLP-dependent enzyme [Thermococcus waiotapuensis]|uniref:Aminotransferase class V-fold PLP-dependent enzyme n=1 Tax=Thermococcus waiotapuensis TaxID=90909 RepID=A0AAE4SXT6_9EURY|nr:aminotransferase class V-fold PLP-dependent enzyme [Thermococcus waiotapuensis]MDV3103044.1 aminotransferase class V-fold PLP-dependent enzyme [Thermococcus waiotapuensis]